MNSASDDTIDNSQDSYEEMDTNVVVDFDPITFFTIPKQLCYFKMIDKFFKTCDTKLIEKMVDIINGKSQISLRVLEWVITKCTKKRVDINIDQKEYYSINIMYKAQLKSYKKKNFDPFRRDTRFYYKYDPSDKTKFVETTLGQLNFFKWAISNKIIECVENNLDTIINAMNSSNKEDKINKVNKKNKKDKNSIDNESDESDSTIKEVKVKDMKNKKKVEIKTTKTKIKNDTDVLKLNRFKNGIKDFVINFD